MDATRLENLIMGEYNNSTPYKNFTSSAIGGINRLAGKRMRDLLSRYSTTGLGRSGIGGAAANDIYSTAGENITSAASQGALMQTQNRQAILSKLLGLYQFEESQPGWEDILGQTLGAGSQVAAAALLA